MELGLSLGNRGLQTTRTDNLGICMGLGLNSSPPSKSSDQDNDDDDRDNRRTRINPQDDDQDKNGSLQLHLLPLSPAPLRTQPPPLRFPWLPPAADTLSSEPGSSEGPGSRAVEEQSSPNSGTSSFVEFSLYTSNNKGDGGKGGKENNINNNNDNNNNGEEVGVRGGSEKMGRRSNSRGSEEEDDESNSSTRKKLRLSKEQSAFLEDNFKEHHTLNPKQKLELAKQLNLRPRQVEVWFQNRRARTKLKQTEVDCEYLKKCCETLTEENRRLQKELQELRVLKTSPHPFFMHLPPTTLTMCPSCERVAPTSNTTLSLGKPTSKKPILPFSSQTAHQATS